jgi:hypothetical protein
MPPDRRDAVLMRERSPRDARAPARDGLAGLAIAAVAVGCCAGLPLLLAVASTVAIGTLLGVAAGIVAIAAAAIGGALWGRRRRVASCGRDAPDRPEAQREASGARR